MASAPSPLSDHPIMDLPDNAPFSPQEVHEVTTTLNNLLRPLREFISLVNDVAIPPAAFLQIPLKQEQLQHALDAFSHVYDLMPRALFEQYIDYMISCRDALQSAEQLAPTAAPGSSLFGPLDLEDGPFGPRLAIPQDLVASLIYDAGLTNQEIADLIGTYLSEASEASISESVLFLA